ncbi:MAG: diphosphatase [Frankiales bacterium]|nr:diphosphatase [Frankiales bacterium]
MTAARPPALSRATVDRDSTTRESPEALESAWRSGEVLVVDEQGRALVDGTELVLVGPDEAPEGDRLYLGGGRYFAVRGPLPRKLGAVAKNLRDVGHLLNDRDAGLLVHTLALANWHVTHPHCPRCGAPTRSDRGGAVRVCVAEGSEHFPRTDPAMIVLVHDGGDRCLLGRQPIWPAGRYSTLAGFVEPGESAEQAVVREVLEETGVLVRDVSYAASQPWPFPGSLMLGFRARADGDAEPVARDGELEDARWFHRDELRDGSAMLPTPVSIAYKLITDWVNGD